MTASAPAPQGVTPDPRILRLGGGLAVIGGLGYLVTLLLHGDLPDQTTEIVLEHIAGRPEWRALKLALIALVICWIGAFATFASSLTDRLARGVSNWAVAVAILGATTMVVEYSILGHAVKGIADAWRAAGPQDSEALLQTVRPMLAISGGLFHSFLSWMIGLPFALLGVAVALDDSYPRWAGWIATVLGLGVLLAGTSRFLGLAVLPYPLVYGGFVVPLTLWLAAMGVVMWRRASWEVPATTRAARAA